MPKLRRQTRGFKEQAVASLSLSIELFNRPMIVGRREAVLIMLQHSFEMLLKGLIYQRRRTIINPDTRISFTFKKCLGIARSNLLVINEDQTAMLGTLDGLRNCATHDQLDVSEQTLYVYSQSAVNLFDEILQKGFEEHLADHLPGRVLPISSNPPRDFSVLIDEEFSQIRDLIRPGKRRTAEARNKIRHLMIVESNLNGDGNQPEEQEINEIIRRIRNGLSWQEIFPATTSLNLVSTGSGLSINYRFTRGVLDAAPVNLLRQGEPGYDDAARVREVNMLDRYSLGPQSLAEGLGISQPKTRALVNHLRMKEDERYYKEFRRGSLLIKGFTPSALERLKEVLSQVDITAIYRAYN